MGEKIPWDRCPGCDSKIKPGVNELEECGLCLDEICQACGG